MRQFRDADSRELKQLTAAQFMEIWDHYDGDGEWSNSLSVKIDAANQRYLLPQTAQT